MPQFNPQQFIEKLKKRNRKQLAVTAGVAIVCVAVWSSFRGQPRAVEEAAWDGIVFPEMAKPPTLTESEPPEPRTSAAAGEAARAVDVGAPRMWVEIAANAPLELNPSRQSEPIEERQAGDMSQVTQPIWLEGGIEAVDASVQ
jgi:hypothetical protein